MSRLLFFGDMAATGFGTVTMDLGRELLALSHDVRFVSLNEYDSLPEPFGSRTFNVRAIANELDQLATLDDEGLQKALVDPVLAASLGITSLALLEEAVVALVDGTLWPDGWRPEAVLILGDYWNAHEFVFKSQATAEAFRRVPTFHYVPVEGVDLPPAWKRLWDVVHPIAMSEFGAEQIRLVTGATPPVVYHGVDTQAFRPVSSERPLYFGDVKVRNREQAKRLFGLHPSVRLVLRTDRLMPRKRYGSLLRAMAPVMARRPDVVLMLHCDPVDQGGHLMDQLSKLHPDIRRRVMTSNGAKVERDLLAAMYNAADVYASPSAEGFGLTIAEAMACGTPAVGMDYSAVTEVIGPGGLLAPVNHLVDNEYDHAWAAVDERAFGEQVAKLLDDEHLRQAIGREARAHVVDKFSWAKAAILFSGIIREHLSVEVAA